MSCERNQWAATAFGFYRRQRVVAELETRMPLAPSLSRNSLRPLHSILLAFPIALFTSAVVADLTYLNTAEIQWTNLSQWAIAGALLLGAPAVLWAAVDWLRGRRSPTSGSKLTYFGIITAMWALGLVNAFKHSQDGWASVGAVGLILSVICAILALVAGWLNHSQRVVGAVT